MHLTARPAPGECRPVRSQGELATKERPQVVLYPQPQWWQKSGGPLLILAKAEAQAEAIGTHPLTRGMAAMEARSSNDRTTL